MAVDGQRFMTKTQHYRKITKPLLERKRRARMNLYLDELKDLIVDTMEAHGEQITKLEKADILEMTVNYLKVHKRQIAAAASPASSHNMEKFRAGYTQAAYEVSKIFTTLPGLDLKFGTELMKHLGYQIKDMQQPALAEHISTENVLRFKETPPHSSSFQAERECLPLKLDEAEKSGDDVWRPW